MMARSAASRRSDRALCIIVDTREQLPYAFDSERVVVFRKTLPAGDYSLVGLEDIVAVERKTLDDLVGSLTLHRDRFMREIELLGGYEAACVVVEADLTDIVQHRYRSKARPMSIIGSIVSHRDDWIIPDCGEKSNVLSTDTPPRIAVSEDDPPR